MAKTDIENTQDTNAIGVVCSALVRHWLKSLPWNPQWDWMRKEMADALHLDLCDECNGSGAQDSGGFTPWDEPINIGCGKCGGEGVLPNKAISHTHEH